MTERGWIVVDRSMVGLDWWTETGPLLRTQEDAIAELNGCEVADGCEVAVAEVRITGPYVTGPLCSEPA